MNKSSIISWIMGGVFSAGSLLSSSPSTPDAKFEGYKYVGQHSASGHTVRQGGSHLYHNGARYRSRTSSGGSSSGGYSYGK